MNMKTTVRNYVAICVGFGQSESSLQNYTMSDLQVRLNVLGISDINIVENIKLCLL